MLKIKINYIPLNWNDYITKERISYKIANSIKQKDKKAVEVATTGEQYKESYPVELLLKPHYKNKRQDLDNFRYKGILDGLVKAGVIKNDNLKCIQKITLDPVFDEEECVEIEIKELQKDEIK